MSRVERPMVKLTDDNTPRRMSFQDPDFFVNDWLSLNFILIQLHNMISTNLSTILQIMYIEFIHFNVQSISEIVPLKE